MARERYPPLSGIVILSVLKESPRLDEMVYELENKSYISKQHVRACHFSQSFILWATLQSINKAYCIGKETFYSNAIIKKELHEILASKRQKYGP